MHGIGRFTKLQAGSRFDGRHCRVSCGVVDCGGVCVGTTIDRYQACDG